MSPFHNPQVHDWDNFWKNQNPAGGHISWSKKRMLSVITPFMMRGRKILDAGCGSGFFSNYFCNCGMKTISVDYSDRALELTFHLTKGRAQILREDLLEDNLPERIGEKFDIIFSDGLLEHFQDENQKKILKNLTGLLEHKGFLITFVPNRWSPWQLIRPFFMPGIDETPFVLRSLVRLHKDCGLTILQENGINTLPFAFSPDEILGRYFGMLLYCIGKKDV